MQKLFTRRSSVGQKVFSFAKVAALTATIAGCAVTATNSRAPATDASVEASADVLVIRDSPTESAVKDVATVRDVQNDSPETGATCPRTVCENVNSRTLVDSSRPCSGGIITVPFVGPPISCNSVFFPDFGPIAIHTEGVEVHGGVDNIIFSMYTSGCSLLMRDRAPLDEARGISYTVGSSSYLFNLLPTRPTTQMYPDSGAEEVLLQTYATNCGEFTGPFLPPSCGTGYHILPVPFAEGNELSVGQISIRVIEISEAVSAADAGMCTTSDRQVRFEFGPRSGPGRIVTTLREGETAFETFASGCFSATVSSVNMTLSAPMFGTCAVSQEYALLTIRLPAQN